ncbi:MAG TPA: SGNH/GDSL hydrolase family protein, partial [Pyrinomonadaceae bacterium]|nr:SGNH/GDSL hydrolase family protein [Pyrinomonadaceae bacterium]
DAPGPVEGNVLGEDPPFKLIVLGESTVAGIGARSHETALTGQLAHFLQRETKQRVEWLAAGRSGVNAVGCRMELVPRLAGRQADLVTIVLGVNDAIEFHTGRRWQSDIERLIEAVRLEVGDVPVLLAGVPPLDCFPALPQPLSFILGARSAALERTSVELARRLRGVVYVPFTIEKEGCEAVFCADGFHPSELGYRLWAKQLAAAFSRRIYSDKRK